MYLFEYEKKLALYWVHVAVETLDIMCPILFVQRVSFIGHGRSKKCSVHKMPLRQQRILVPLMRSSFGRTAAPTCLASARSWTMQA